MKRYGRLSYIRPFVRCFDKYRVNAVDGSTLCCARSLSKVNAVCEMHASIPKTGRQGALACSPSLARQHLDFGNRAVVARSDRVRVCATKNPTRPCESSNPWTVMAISAAKRLFQNHVVAMDQRQSLFLGVRQIRCVSGCIPRGHVARMGLNHACRCLPMSERWDEAKARLACNPSCACLSGLAPDNSTYPIYTSLP